MRRTLMLLVVVGVLAAAGCTDSPCIYSSEEHFVGVVRAALEEAGVIARLPPSFQVSDTEIVALGREVCRGMTEMGVDEYFASLVASGNLETDSAWVGDTEVPAALGGVLVGSSPALCPEHENALGDLLGR